MTRRILFALPLAFFFGCSDSLSSQQGADLGAPVDMTRVGPDWNSYGRWSNGGYLPPAFFERGCAVDAPCGDEPRGVEKLGRPE